MAIKIVGLAHRLGSDVLEASAIEEHFQRDAGTIAGLSGVSRLHRIAEGENLVSLACAAAREALNRAGCDLASVSGVYSSCNPTTEYLIPSLAPLVASGLGLTHIQACAVGMGCAGGVQALQAAWNQLTVDSLHGRIRTYIVVTGDHTSRMLDKESWKTAILFSDGVSAVVITNDPAATGGFCVERVASECYAGDQVDVINLPNALAQGSGADKSSYLLQMRGRGVFEFGVKIAPRVRELSGMESFSDTYIIPHQANIRMLRELPPTFDVPESQLYTDGITRIGNISGAACFLGLEDADRRGLVRAGQRILLCAFGAELQVAVALLTKEG